MDAGREVTDGPEAGQRLFHALSRCSGDTAERLELLVSTIFEPLAASSPSARTAAAQGPHARPPAHQHHCGGCAGSTRSSAARR